MPDVKPDSTQTQGLLEQVAQGHESVHQMATVDGTPCVLALRASQGREGRLQKRASGYALFI
jgi:hypothetical protein